jgi:predicted DNA-binding transcriptional regulator AlpA
MSLVTDAGEARKHGDRLISIREAGKIVGLSKSTIYERLKVGQFPPKAKQGKLTVFSLHEIEAYVAALLAGRP